MSKEQDQYVDFLKNSRQRSVFAMPWWLDIVSGGQENWKPNLVYNTKNEVVAAWPLSVRETKLGLVSYKTPYTPFLGPLLGRNLDVNQDVKLLKLLAENLNSYAHIEANCIPELDYWTPLSWHEFTQTTKTTWRIDGGMEFNEVLNSVRKKTKGALSAAERDGMTVRVASTQELIRACEATFTRQAINQVPSRKALEQLANEAVRRGHAEILGVENSSGELVSAGLFVFDDRWTWNLANGRISEAGSVGAPTLLIITAIKHALERGTGFDFEGSMIKSIERFVRGFGGKPHYYSVLNKSSKQWSKHVARKRMIKKVIRLS